MRIKTFALCTSSIALAICAAPVLAQEAMTPGTQQAQEAPADPTDVSAVEGEEIIVTGFRESLRSAQGIKRNSRQIVDSIVAEDIGKLPDLSVSDTAARIPGIQVIRRGGEADAVLVRGLPDFSTTYNGREIFTAERREVALQDFPSANIAALDVFKTTTANLVEPGLAGQINVRSRRPFDFESTEIAGSAWALYTKQAGKVTPNFNALASTRWETGAGEMGLLVNVSRTELDFLDSEPSNTDFIADPTINGQQVRFPDIQRLFYRAGNRVRPSVNAAFQWRPSDTFELYADFLYQGFRNKIDDRLAAVPLYGGGAYSNLVFRNGTNLLDSGTVTGLGDPIFSFQGGTFNKTDTYQFAVGGIYESGPLKLTLDLARTDSTFKGSTESVDRIFANQGTTSIDFDLTTPQFTVNNFDVANPANYLFDGLYEEDQESKGDDYQARLDAEYDLGEESLLRTLQVGVRYTDRDGRREFGNRFAGVRGRNIPITALPLELKLARRGFRGTDVQSGFETFLAPTYGSIRENRVELRQFVRGLGFANFTDEPVAPNPVASYTANERTLSGYAQVNFGFGERIDGTIGIRAVRTKTEVDGTTGAGGVLTPASLDQSYTDWLPNASVRFRITPELQLRLSATQTRTRPTFQQLNPAFDVGAPDPLRGGLREGSAGNPDLRLFTSNNYDASLEYYFSRTGFASVALFRRDLDGFILTQTDQFIDPTLGPVRVTRPVNTRDGRIDGFEAQFTTFLDFDGLPEFLQNFGVQANYTYLDDEVEFLNTSTGQFERGRIVLPNAPVDLGGLSKHTYNLAGIYESDLFSARLSWNKRSKFLDRRDPRGDEAGGLYREIAFPAGRLDLSTNVNVMENVTLFFDWTNITEKPFRVNFSSARNGAPRAEYVRFLRYEETTFSGGVRFRF
jgi:iron complex outermembrane recepter protein